MPNSHDSWHMQGRITAEQRTSHTCPPLGLGCTGIWPAVLVSGMSSKISHQESKGERRRATLAQVKHARGPLVCNSRSMGKTRESSLV